MEEIKIYSSKKKIFLSLLGSLVFVIIGICLLLNPATDSNSFLKSPIVVKIVGISSILFFGFATYVLFRKAFKKEVMLTINEKGINVNPNKEGFILWQDIEGFSEIRIVNVKIIIIQVRNPANYIEKEKNKIKQNLMEYNLKNYGSPFNISASAMDISYKKLFQILNENLITYIRSTS